MKSPENKKRDPDNRIPFKKINEEVEAHLVAVGLLEQALLEPLVKELSSSFDPSFLSPSCEHLLS